MTDDDRDAALRAARAEADALRALLASHGAGAPAPVALPNDEALLARILASGPAGDRPIADPADPADPVDPADPAAAGPPAPVLPLTRRAPRPARRRVLAAVAGIAAAAVGGTVLALLPLQDPPAAVASGSPPLLALPVAPEDLAAGEGAPARDTLLELAATAADQVDPEPAGDVQHVRSQAWYLSTSAGNGDPTSTVDPVVRETWLEPDGALTALEWRGQHLGEDGRLAAIDTTPADATVDRLPTGTLDPEKITDLSDDPATLRAELLELAGGADLGCGPGTADAAWCVYRAVTTATDGYVLPSSFESTLWTVLADEPGLTLAGEVTDRTGRRAVALAVPPPANPVAETVQVLLVDAGTGRLSGHEEVTLRSEPAGIDEPTVTQFRYEVIADHVAEPGGAAGPDGAAAPSGLQLHEDGGHLVRELARQVAQRSHAGGEPVPGSAVDGGAPAGGLLGRGPAGEQPGHRAGQDVAAA